MKFFIEKNCPCVSVALPPFLSALSPDLGKHAAERYSVYSLNRAEKCKSGKHELVFKSFLDMKCSFKKI